MDQRTQTANGCPVVHLKSMDEVIEGVRSKKILHHPDMFAGVPADPVNGEINVNEFLRGSIVFTHGQEHRDRRRLLNHLLRPDALHAIREEIIIPAARTLIEQRLRVRSADGLHRMDLVEFCERVFLHFTAKLIGLVDTDSDERMARLRSCAGPLAAGASSQFLENRTEINRIALAAKSTYVEEFYRPSRDHYGQLIDQVNAGTLAADAVPSNIMSLIAQGADPAYRDEDRAIVETTMMFAASVGTSTQSIIQTVHFLLDWFEKHPEDRARRTDQEFLLNSIQETVRLRAPFSPYTTRMAVEDGELGGHQLSTGQEIHVHYVAANRDTGHFGADAGEFNPNRPTPTDRRMPRYGVGFGTGVHQCFGLRVVLGHEGIGGAHVRLLQLLFELGVDADPSDQPEGLKKDMNKFTIEDIPRYTRYPAVFRNWQ
ncbi:MAG TPA: cytochrome P450 [Pseudonocardia sp.]